VNARSRKDVGSSVNTYYSEPPNIRGILRLTGGSEQCNVVSCALPATALFSSALSKLNQAYLKCSKHAGCTNRVKTAASSCTGSYHSAFSAHYNGCCVLTAANTPSTISQFTAHQSYTFTNKTYKYIKSHDKLAVTNESGKRNLDRTSGLAPIVDVLECVYHK